MDWSGVEWSGAKRSAEEQSRAEWIGNLVREIALGDRVTRLKEEIRQIVFV